MNREPGLAEGQVKGILPLGPEVFDQVVDGEGFRDFQTPDAGPGEAERPEVLDHCCVSTEGGSNCRPQVEWGKMHRMCENGKSLA